MNVHSLYKTVGKNLKIGSEKITFSENSLEIK